MSIHTFTDLVAWQEARKIALETYALTKTFPTDERFGLVDQMRRSAISVSSNIAEGFGRSTAKDKNQFYSIAKGSLMELHSQSIIASDLGYIDKMTLRSLEPKFLSLSKIVSGLMKSSFSRVIS